MANPLKKGCNLVGTLVAAASNSTTSGDIESGSLELGLAIGTALASGASASTNAIDLPSREFNCVFLVKLSSGPATFVADVASNGSAPTFAGARASTVTDSTAGAPVFVGPVVSYAPTQTVSDGDLTTSTVQNKVALKITPTNNATVQKLCLIASIVVGKKNESHSIKKAFEIKAPPVGTGIANDNTGVWMP